MDGVLGNSFSMNKSDDDSDGSRDVLEQDNDHCD
jgi:hypothetical protein